MRKVKINSKTDEEIEIMIDGGKKLGKIKKKLMDKVGEGVSADVIEKLAIELVAKTGGKPSFAMVSGYSWATCVNVNAGVVHGIPHKTVVFKKGDIVSVDIGLYLNGFHTDTSFSVGIGVDEETKQFLEVGKGAFDKVLGKLKPGNRIYDMSRAIQEKIKGAGYTPIRALVGHGIGKELHEEPQIPCFVKGQRKDSPIIPENATFAIEVMYVLGSPEIAVSEDGWTISTRDGKISALFEETVAVTKNGPLVLTRAN